MRAKYWRTHEITRTSDTKGVGVGSLNVHSCRVTSHGHFSRSLSPAKKERLLVVLILFTIKLIKSFPFSADLMLNLEQDNVRR